MREIFTRIEENTPITIEVATDVAAEPKAYPWLVSVFIKYAKPKEDEENYTFLELKESLIIALELEKKAVFVGMRVVDGWSELYFYAREPKAHEATVAKLLKEMHYPYESHAVKDAKWDFYEMQLFPSDLEFCHIQSAKIIFLLQEEGDTLLEPREVEFYAVFDTPTQKERFIAHAIDAGFTYKDDLSTEEYDHGVAMTRVQSVSEEAMAPSVESFFEMVQKERGHYEGWSTVFLGDASDEEE